MKLIKLTTQTPYRTRVGHDNETLWGEGVEHTTPGTGVLCGPGYIHAYTDARIAVYMNCVHAQIIDPVGWESDGDIAKTDHGLKVGCTRLRTDRIIELPILTTKQRTRAAIRCAMAVSDWPGKEAWWDWAVAWLSGADRARPAAAAAHEAANAAANVAFAAAAVTVATSAAAAAAAATAAAANAANAAVNAYAAANAATNAAVAVAAAFAAAAAAAFDLGAIIIAALEEYNPEMKKRREFPSARL